MPEELIPTSPFDFRQMLRRPLSRLSKVTVIDAEAGSYTRAIRLGTRVVPVTVVVQGTVDQSLLRIIHPEGLSDSEQAEVHERLARMFNTHVNVQDFYSRMQTQPGWEGLIKQLYGLRPIQDADLFESMVKVIVGQQLNVQFAATLVERLVDLGGEVVDWHDTALPVFPSAERVADWSYQDLRALSFSQRKAEYVIDFARAIVDGHVDLDGLWSQSDAGIYDTLMPLRGIGRWTVECFLLFGMGRPDVMPAADIGVQNAMQKLYGVDHRPKEDEVRELSEAWAPWRSYATYYLWQSLIRVN